MASPTSLLALIKGVPDAGITTRDVVAGGDRLTLRFVLTGTHQDELFGVTGTGRSLEVESITIVHFANGIVVERWNRLDDRQVYAVN